MLFIATFAALIFTMLDKLEAIKARFDDLGVALTNPEIVSDNKKFVQLSRKNTEALKNW